MVVADLREVRKGNLIRLQLANGRDEDLFIKPARHNPAKRTALHSHPER